MAAEILYVYFVIQVLWHICSGGVFEYPSTFMALIIIYGLFMRLCFRPSNFQKMLKIIKYIMYLFR